MRTELVTFSAHSCGNAGSELASIDPEFVQQRLRRFGAVLLRDFSISLADFRAFSDRLSSQCFAHLNFSRDYYGDRTLTGVTPGQSHFFAHAEMGYTPLRPRVAWFYCERPAASGGETTIYDGCAVLESLQPSTRQMFEQRPLLFEQHLPKQAWIEWAPDLDALRKLLDRFAADNFFYEVDAAECLYTRYTPSAIQASAAGPAFCNSLLDYEAPRFEDGTVIPKRILHEIIASTEDVAAAVAWRKSDLLILDNLRFMHGRRAFTDPGRRIMTRFTNVDL